MPRIFIPHKLEQKLIQYRQDHLLRCIELMTEQEQKKIIHDLQKIDFDLIDRLYNSFKNPPDSKLKKDFEPPRVLSVDSETEKTGLSDLGESFIKQGRVGLFLVAGGQASRLGYDYPKGCFPVSPIKKKSLFQLFSEYILALQQKLQVSFKWYIMTSSENHENTINFFEKHSFFGLKNSQISFFSQGEIPSVGLDGRLLVSPDKKICRNPDGHGGSIFALKRSGALDEMEKQGIDEIFYFQVDNPLVRIADPVFVGAHLKNEAEMSTKVIQKTDPAEKVGVIGKINGKLGCIEYSELDDDLKKKRNPDGSLLFGSANTAIHILNRAFVQRLTEKRLFSLPYHSAIKQINCLELQSGNLKKISKEGLKFEMFIFDALGFAKNPVTMLVNRHEEFSPVKNRQGSDSPETALKSMSSLHRKWLEKADVDLKGLDNVEVEISPLYALNENEFRKKFNNIKELPNPLYFE